MSTGTSVMGWAGLEGASAALDERVPSGLASTSSVFHSPHPSHRPAHLRAMSPQVRQR
jgi:hypothetical protein